MKKICSVITCLIIMLLSAVPAYGETTDYVVVDVTSGEDVVSTAVGYIGAAYTWGGETPEEGFDCSGFVNYVFKTLGIYVSRTVKGISNNGTEVDLSEIKTGDVVIFKLNHEYIHCGIYVGDGQIIHSFNESKGVVITDINECNYDDIVVRRLVQ